MAVSASQESIMLLSALRPSVFLPLRSRLLSRQRVDLHFSSHCEIDLRSFQKFRFIESRFLSSCSPSSSSSHVALRPWKTHMVESTGDYRQEAFLEEHIGGPLYEHQKHLPKLPIPTIEETLDRFLPTALPLAKTEAEKSSLIAACESFPEQAKILQERLNDRRNNEMSNTSWLMLWWNQLAYLQYRGSVVINVSYFFQFQDDPMTEVVESKANLQRAAAILFAAGEFRKDVCSGNLPADRIGKKQIPLCSTPYKYMFNACRIPQSKMDAYRIYDPSRYNHCVIARNGHFFSIDIIHPETGNPLPVQTLERQLQECIESADARPPGQLGLLTSLNRDSWSTAREQLLKAGGVAMEEALEKIESGAFLLSLDDTAPVSRDECCENLLTGGKASGNNRWFDKSIQLLVSKNGKAGILGEHSMMDGMVLINVSNHITNTTYADATKRSQVMVESPTNVKDIFAEAVAGINESVVGPLIDEAAKEFHESVSAQSNRTQSFQGYGSNFIKIAGHPPDAYVQMAMQLAAYRLFGEQVGTYEATQVRLYLHGRTETTRSVSPQSAAFIQAMGQRPKKDSRDVAKRRVKLDLLKEATVAHSQYTATAAQAAGVDRHFTGLSMLVQDGEEIPALLSDPVFVRSKTWRLSTSNLTHPNFTNWGFGQVVPDGVGIGYSIHPRSCVFNITALAETDWSMKLSELLEEALLEMQELVELDQAEGADFPPQ